MMFFTWVRAIGIFAAVLSICRGQIFPFSNLKHFFDQKPRVLIGGAGAAISESESETKPQASSPPSRTAAKATEDGGALLPTPVPTAVPTTAPTTRFPIFSGPLSYFDDIDGFRDFRMPDSAPQLSKHQNSKQNPKPPPPPPQKQKPSDARAPLYIPLNIAYENSIGDGPPPSLFLTPPPPPNQVPDAAPSASHALLITNKEKLETAASSSLPPVPDLFLRPPSVNADMTFFKYPDNALSNAVSETGQLELSDVAKAAVSVSKNPAIAKETSLKSSDEKVPPNHKTTTHPGNALDVPRHKDDLGTHFKPIKERKPVKGGENQNGPTNHRPDFGTAKGPPASDSSSGFKHLSHNDSLSATSTLNKEVAVFESSPSEAAALGPSRPQPHSHPGPRHNHHKYAQPALHPNHRPQQHQDLLQQPQLRPAKSGKPQKHGSNKGHNKHLNHQPDHRDYLEVEESMSRPKYRKKNPHHNHQPYQPFEQEVAESGLHSEGGVPHSSDGDRVEFQMHGMEGPKSYKFGYDTGKGHNRQFRYEERDPHGNVKGHYGYVDQNGKLQIVNYKADPHHGYSADVSKLQI